MCGLLLNKSLRLDEGGDTNMDFDKIEIIADQFNSLKNLWHVLRASSINQHDKDSCEELLLDIFESKARKLSEVIKSR